jgi:RNA polymerase sigma-70 factor (ECF subfamily)
MPPEPALASQDAFTAQHAQLIEILYVEANCVRWELPRDCFAEALRRSADQRFRNAGVGHLEIEAYLKSLRVVDLGLACACAAGFEKAWEFFVKEFRPELRSGARAILRAAGQSGDARAEELADSLYAELYGVRSTNAEPRKSLFTYFHGRSKLSTWLHAIMAQRHVDSLRTSARLVSLELDTESEASRPELIAARANTAPPDPDREMYLSRLGHALDEALAELPARERMILVSYYTDQRTLAEIGRMLREHESTISRQLDRTRRALREDVAAVLRRGLDETQIEQAFEYALEDWAFDLSRSLSKAEKRGKN